MLLLHLLTPAYASGGDEEVSFGLIDIFFNSGPIALAVILILAIMLLVTFIVSVERLIAFARARGQSMTLAMGIVRKFNEQDIEGALKLTNDEMFKVSYLAAVLRAGLREMSDRRDEWGVKNADREIEKAITIEVGKLRRGMTILATVGSTAPFVGLFGTTFGVINAFDGMATKGSGLASISSGISEALITTGVGIGVAVIGVWAFNYFNQRIEKVTDELHTSAQDFMNWSHKLIQPAYEAPALVQVNGDADADESTDDGPALAGEDEPATDPGVAVEAGK
jgi:biopolymer transport protein ExbB/biopolymer transport protein TolQ